jgi:hypothetical protein
MHTKFKAFREFVSALGVGKITRDVPEIGSSKVAGVSNYPAQISWDAAFAAELYSLILVCGAELKYRKEWAEHNWNRYGAPLVNAHTSLEDL